MEWNLKKELFFFFGAGFRRILTNGYVFSTLFAAVLYHTENIALYPQSFSVCTILKFLIFNINFAIP